MILSVRAYKNKSSRVPVALATLWLFAVMALRTASAEPLLYTFHAPAGWVGLSAVEYGATPTPGADVGPTWILLLDHQVNVLADGEDHYQHVAVKVLSSTGAERASQLNIVVDPTFQRLAIHSLQIVRAGAVIDERKSARITVLPQETELRERIYNGRYNINVLLADVRAGDVIEYSYTLHSQEKLFPGHFATRFDVGWDEMIHREHVRFSWPAGRKLQYRLGGGAQALSPQIRSGTHELTLEWQDIKPILADDDAPAWYAQWPYLEVSDLQSWAEVAELVLPLFVHPARVGSGARVQAVVDEIRTRGGTPAEQVLHAVQYVQEQVQYASISIGRGTYMPTAPEEVLKRNFGDCKDKSLLLAMILRELGVEAVPALVNSRTGKTLADRLPTPYAFDHAIVHLQLAGKGMWVDPTVPKRYSALSPTDPPDYETALLLARPIQGLYNIPRPAFDSQRKAVTKLFNLTSGTDKPATLEVIQSYTQSLADDLRVTLASVGRAQLELDLRNRLGRYYPDATPLSPLIVEDHPEWNLIEIQGRYQLRHAFVKNREGTLEFPIHAQELYAYAEPLDSSVRRSPLALQFPLQLHEHIAVILPGEWPVEPSVVEVRNPAFLYRSRVEYARGRLDIDYEYTALADHVELAALGRYLEDRRRVYDDLGYVLYQRPQAQMRGFAAAPLPVLVLIAALVGGVWIAVRRGYRYDPQPRLFDSDAPVGLRGWLAVVSFGVCVAPLAHLLSMSLWLKYIDANVWDGLPAAVSGGYRGWVQPVLLALMALSSLLLIGQILIAVLFFKRRSSVPVFMIAVQWVTILLSVGLALFFGASGLSRMSGARGRLAAMAFSGIVWTTYLLTSQRVRATFVRRLGGAEPQAGEDGVAVTNSTGG
jgi:transglutaminase-like putative cysteine protease